MFRAYPLRARHGHRPVEVVLGVVGEMRLNVPGRARQLPSASVRRASCATPRCARPWAVLERRRRVRRDAARRAPRWSGGVVSGRPGRCLPKDVSSRERLRRSHTVCHWCGGRGRWTCVTATRITVRWCGFDRVPHRRLWCRNMLFRSHPHPRCHGGQAAADPAMPRPARGGTVLVAALAHRRMFGDPDRGQSAHAAGWLCFCRAARVWPGSPRRCGRGCRRPGSVDTTRCGSRRGGQVVRRSPDTMRTIPGPAPRPP